MDNQFRNAAFGGFNRQDVMDYLERSAKEHAEALEQLRSLLDAAQKERDQLAAQVQALTEERDSCQSTAQQTAAMAEQLPGLQEENGLLKERVAQLEPDAAAYAAIKERMAGMELDAHRRAQEIVDQAREQSDELLRQTQKWLVDVRGQYDELRGVVEGTVSRAAGELDRMRQSLGNISLCIDRQGNAMDQFVRNVQKNEEN